MFSVRLTGVRRTFRCRRHYFPVNYLNYSTNFLSPQLVHCSRIQFSSSRSPSSSLPSFSSFLSSWLSFFSSSSLISPITPVLLFTGSKGFQNFDLNSGKPEQTEPRSEDSPPSTSNKSHKDKQGKSDTENPEQPVSKKKGPISEESSPSTNNPSHKDGKGKTETKNLEQPISNDKEKSKPPRGFGEFYKADKGFSNFKLDDDQVKKKKDSQKKEKPIEKEQTQTQTQSKPEKSKSDTEKKSSFADFFDQKNKEKSNSKKSEKDDSDGDRGNWFPGMSGLGSEDPKSKSTIALIAIALALAYWYFTKPESDDLIDAPITFQEFKENYLRSSNVSRLVVKGDIDEMTKMVYVYTKESPDIAVAGFRIGSINTFETQLEEIQISMEIDPLNFVPVQYAKETTHKTNQDTLINMAHLGITVLFMYFIFKRVSGSTGGGRGKRGIFSIGKSNATIIKPGDKTSVTFKDVAGLDNAKNEVMEFVKFLKNPERFTRLGAKLPKGALLVGPPGTGKTLLAKATAGEASVPFFSISGSDFIEMFVGVGPSRVRDLFGEARKNAPCIIFIDEIDAVGRARGEGKFGGGNDERENTLNQMLVEMDGFEDTEQLVVIAGTNRADILDPALLRPGRFDRQIQIEKPDINGREQILKVHLKPLTLALDIDEVAHRLGCLTPGFTGADLANVCNEAAIVAARSDKDQIDLEDFESAVDRVLAGIESNTILSKEERELVAYHEAGHAVVGWFLEHADPLLKVTIIPRGKGALGFAQYLPNEIMLRHKQQLIDSMCTALGGRAAEQVFFGRVSTGASNDLQQVSRLARAQVATFGMNERLGNVNYEMDPNGFQKPFSERTAQIIDEEVEAMIAFCYTRTIDMVEKYKDKVKALGEKLLEMDTVSHDIIVEILGPRPFAPENYKQVINHMESAKNMKKSKAETTESTTENKKKNENDSQPDIEKVTKSKNKKDVQSKKTNQEKAEADVEKVTKSKNKKDVQCKETNQEKAEATQS